MNVILVIAIIIVCALIVFYLMTGNGEAGNIQIVKNIVHLEYKVEFHYSLKGDSQAEVSYTEGDDVIRLYSAHLTRAYAGESSRPFVLIHGHENMKLLRGALNDIATVDKYI